jgi:cysteinyl-tRNA synthetase
MIEYSLPALEESVRAYQRVESFLRKITQRTGAVEVGAPSAEFVAAMDDDLATPAALAAVHNAVRVGNTAMDDGDDAAAREAASAVRGMTDILGLDPLSAKWSDRSTEDTGLRAAVAALVEGLLDERQRARANKDFALADAIRDRLLNAGVAVEDTPGGPLWTVKD